jgi:mRNA interferase RelE/StbE
MKYSIQIASSAERQFQKLQPSLQERITSKILQLASIPRPYGSKKLHDSNYYRISIGNYRVLYSINDGHKIIKILDVGHRREIYR